jgi:predicted TIM-barrel fold metal-dependent hydrolase
MIIDFHTHVFPDNLAERAMAALSAEVEDIFSPVNNGTVSGLIHDMDNWNISRAVVLPVITKQSQTKSTNEWVSGIASDRLISFGGVYPHTDDYKRDIDFVAGLGLKGIKFHAEYQNFIIDDDQMLKLYDYALGKGLIIIHHAGADPAFQPPFKSSPAQFAKIVKAMKGGTIVAAHFGGHDQWDDVEKYLVGENIYLDTSMGFEYFPHDQFLRIVKNHGADKILFASDYPWSSAKTEIEHLKSLPLSDDEKNAIFGGNAARILGV